MRGRIRTVKPELFTDEELWDLAEATGLPLLQAFVGLWCFADREGRFEWRPRALKSAVLPFWEGDMTVVLGALESGGFITCYSVDDREYAYVTKFRKHQVVNAREAKSDIPPPPVTATHVRALVMPVTGHGDARGEGNGRELERKGTEGVAHASDHDPDCDPHECETIPAPADEAPAPRERLLEPVDDGWQSPFPPEAEGTPPVWRSLRGWEPSDELYAEAKVQGVSKEVFDRQLAKLRNGPIGGSRGVFDRDDYVRLQIPHWRTWDETDRAKASLAPPGFRSGFRGSGAPPPLEPSKRHLAFAEKHAIAIAPIVNGLALEGVVDALGHQGALEELGRRLLAARKAKEAAA